MRTNMTEGKMDVPSIVSDVQAQPMPLVGRERSASKLGNGATKARGNSLSIRSIVPETFTFPRLNYGIYYDNNFRIKKEDLKEFPETTYRAPIDIVNWFDVLISSYEICSSCPGFLDYCSFPEFAIISTCYLIKKSQQLHSICNYPNPFAIGALDCLPDDAIPPIICDYVSQMGYCYEENQVGVPFIKLPKFSVGQRRGRSPDIVDDDEYDDPLSGFFPFGELYDMFIRDAQNPQDKSFFVEDLFLDAPDNTRRISLRNKVLPKMSVMRRKNLPEGVAAQPSPDSPFYKICLPVQIVPQYYVAISKVFEFVKRKNQSSEVWCYGIGGEVVPPFSLEFELLASVPIVFPRRLEVPKYREQPSVVGQEEEDPP